jgi:hypothetical protein
MTRAFRGRRDALARETTFEIGGALVIAMGVGLAVGLAWSGAGWIYVQAWVGAALAIGFGAFFVAVGWAERAERHRFLRGYDPNEPPPGPAER